MSILSVLAEAKKIQAALQAFTAQIVSGSVVLPGDLDTSNMGTAMWPVSICYNNFIVPIDYDPVGNVITLSN